jgi:small-conductance mechanosensitive channel
MTTIEAPLTEQEALRFVTEWESKLALAKRTLNDYESQMGNAALLGKAGEVATELQRLELEVRIAEQALQAAQRQSSKAKDGRYVEMLDQAKKRAAEVEGYLAADEAYLAEWKEVIDNVEAARKRIDNNARFLMSVEANIMDLQARIREQKAKEKANNGQ